MRLATLLLSLLCAAFATRFAAAKQMNILVFHADDWRFDTLGCVGGEIALFINELRHAASAAPGAVSEIGNLTRP